MAKRKVNDDEENELYDDNSGSDAAPLKPKAKNNRARQTSKAVKREEEDQLDSDDEPPLVKKPKKENQRATSAREDTSKSVPSDLVIKSTPDGDKYVELGKRRRVTVRSFKGNPLIDIREFYEASGSEKPGKKGIALSLEQWEALQKSSSTIDELVAGLKK